MTASRSFRSVRGLHAQERRAVEDLLKRYDLPFRDCPDVTLLVEDAMGHLFGTASLQGESLTMVAVVPGEERSGLVADLVARSVEEARRRGQGRLTWKGDSPFPMTIDLSRRPEGESLASLTAAIVVDLLDRKKKGA